MPKLPNKLAEKLSMRSADNAFRKLQTSGNLVDFSSNDYLGFAKNKDIFLRSTEILKEHNLVTNGATGSRLLTGNHVLFETLENMLSDFHEAESALVFNSGYDANLGFFGSVPQRGDIVFYDEFIHASIRDGIKLGNAFAYKYKHNDLEDLIQKCKAERGRSHINAEFYVVTESVFSMDGDSPDLKQMSAFCNLNGHHLVVDEAHALGVFGTKGEGLAQHLGLESQIFARIVTFGKAMGCQGAAILGPKTLIEYLINFARPFIYTTGLSPHAAATVLAAYTHGGTSEALLLRTRLKRNVAFFKGYSDNFGLNDLGAPTEKSIFIPSNSAIQSCIAPGNEAVKKIALQLQQAGFDVRPILSPTIPIGKERLRFCLHAFNTEAQISNVIQKLYKILAPK